MAWEASLVEQDFSNDMERRMCEEAASSKRKVDHGWAVGREVGSHGKVMSNMSSSTCVDFNESPPPLPGADWPRVAEKVPPQREFVGLEGP